MLENFRRTFSPGSTDCPWVSEDVFAGEGRESGVSPSGGGVCYKSCDAFVHPAFFSAGNRARNGVANVVAFENLFTLEVSSILSIKVMLHETIRKDDF